MGPVTGAHPPEQPALAGLEVPAVRRRRAAAPSGPAATAPVARVCVDLAPPHLDRPFEYLVPADLDTSARPGVRVKVRFAGQDVDGWLLERVDRAEHDGRLLPLRRVVSDEAVVAPQVLALARAVADRWAGTLADVLRLAVPPRHARVESERHPAAGTDAAPTPETSPVDVGRDAPPAPAWDAYRGGPAFLRHVRSGGAPRAVWTALPGAPDGAWPAALAQAVAACVAGNRGALVVVPDGRDVDRVCRALAALGLRDAADGGTVARLVADAGAAARYRAFLATLHGRARVVVGTRASAFAPVADLGLAVCWDDGDLQHAEPRAPYPHVRDVLALRSELEGAALLVGGHARTVEAQQLVATGWAHEVVADRATVRARTPRVTALTSLELAREGPAAAARLPAPAWRALRDALADGPVLVQVPRAGYVPVVACVRCRTPARCGACHGPLGLTRGDGPPSCGWCGRLATDRRCDECGATGLRSVRVGSERTAEELGRAFPGVTVRVSGARAAGGVLADVPDRPALVVATPGAEPHAPSGYVAAVLLDAAVASAGERLGAEVDALRRWLAAASLVRPAGDGGRVLLVGDGAVRPTQALVRWDPAWLASRELDERAELLLPPTVRVAAVTGARDAVAALVARVDTPGVQVLGPVPLPSDDQRGRALDPEVRTLLRVPPGDGAALARAVAASAAIRSARREGGAVRVQLDPVDLL
ncbi:primosomal protein N' (replication factor Y) - superfamily II helicase-like protein [Cellulomonas flavigena DSM 20109]|uniref:Probable replication restart protein PriA n=1 Tax=Cellulomonas flavigena (strain ATCC 482 / DSM 20109 / BCRC 11376 / JCM 18109 / NBRC 3775 / NCIMB 8073 / NRS 134) TaxID=446466 RepID=D5UEU1_CELFN|nr:primosomal protein N' [Cellulomonas flavigena]ADG74751.1 primosomal protein N' (replication factor Y) - superfamily II helicase-like protein [Cellulomonas flavigena DSM 20109]